MFDLALKTNRKFQIGEVVGCLFIRGGRGEKKREKKKANIVQTE